MNPDIFSNIITGDESSCYKYEIKNQSSECQVSYVRLGTYDSSDTCIEWEKVKIMSGGKRTKIQCNNWRSKALNMLEWKTF